MPYLPPRRIASTATSITVQSLAAITWPTSIPVSTYASVPVVGGKSIAEVSPALAFSADNYIGASYSQNLVWNEDFGPGGGGLFTGGGHATTDWAHAWVFDGSIPGWVQLTNFPTTQFASSTTYASGAEVSTTQANMPGDAVLNGNYYCKPQPFDPAYPAYYGYPAFDGWEYGEVQTGMPLGFHTWNSIFKIPANVAGMGSKGGWGSVCHHSMSVMSGKGSPWGHKIDAATGQWSRWAKRIPVFSIGNDMGACMHAVSDGNFAYTKWNYLTQGGSRAVKTDLTTGAHTVINHSNQVFSVNNLAIIPGTTVAAWLGCGDTTNLYGAADGQARVWACLLSEGSSQIACNMVNNTMPSSSYWDSCTETSPNSGFGQAALVWVPEVSKFAAFHQAPTSSTNGTWPLKIFWITPPVNVQANYATGSWTVEEESLSINAGDTKAASAFNRGTFGFQYQSFAWSSKLKCFLHFPRPGAGMCFFIRTSKVP